MPEQEQKFTGGQCDGVLYRVYWTLNSNIDVFGTRHFESGGGIFFGPVGDARAVDRVTPNANQESEGHGTYVEIYCRGRAHSYGSYDHEGGYNGYHRTPGEPGWHQDTSFAAGNFGLTEVNAFVRYVEPADGQPDTCGDRSISEDPNTNPYNRNEDNNCCSVIPPLQPCGNSNETKWH